MDRLDLSLGDVGVIGVLTAVATTVSFMVWARWWIVAGRWSPCASAACSGSSLLVACALAPDVSVLWVAAVAAGAAGASIDVGLAAVISDQTSLTSRSAAMAGLNAMTGARGIGAAFLMSVLLQLGVVDVTSGLLLCSVATGIGVILYARTNATAPVVADRSVAPDRPVLPSAIGRVVDPSSTVTPAGSRAAASH